MADLLSSGRLTEEGRRTLQKAKEVLQLGDAAADAVFETVAGQCLASSRKSSECLSSLPRHPGFCLSHQSCLRRPPHVTMCLAFVDCGMCF